MTQLIDPNENSDLNQATTRRLLAQNFTGIESGFIVTDSGTFLVDITAGKLWINGTYVDDDLVRTNLDLSIAPSGDLHFIIYATQSASSSFPPSAMTITAASAVPPLVPVIPADSVKIADVFVPAAAASMSDCTIINAPPLPDRGHNDGDIIIERLLTSNMNILFSGGGTFSHNGTDTLTWSSAIDLISTVVTNKEKFLSAPLSAIRIPAGSLGASPVVSNNCILFAVFDRSAVIADPSSPTAATLHVLDLASPDAGEAELFYGQGRDDIVFVAAIIGGAVRVRGGVGGSLPAADGDGDKFLRNDPGGSHYWSTITADLIEALISFVNFYVDEVDLELGSSIVTPSFSAETSVLPGVSAQLTNDADAEDKNVLPDFSGVDLVTTSAGTFTKVATGANQKVVFTLSIVHSNSPDVIVATSNLNFYRRAYSFASVEDGDGGAADYNETWTKGLCNLSGGTSSKTTITGAAASESLPLAGRVMRVAAAALVSEYLYFAYDAAHGALTSIKDKNNSDFNVLGAFTEVTAVESFDVEDYFGNGLDENYRVYKSNNLLTGTFDYETA